MNISFFSGKIFIHYLQIYNDYIEKLENETIYFFEKKIKDFKEISKYSDTNILLENFFLEKLNQIIKEFNLNFNKLSNIPEKFKKNLIDALNKTIKNNNIEINDIKKRKIIDILCNINLQIKNKDFFNINYSYTFFNQLKNIIFNSFERQKQNLVNNILDNISMINNFYFAKEIGPEIKNEKFDKLKEKFEILKNDIMNQINKYNNLN